MSEIPPVSKLIKNNTSNFPVTVEILEAIKENVFLTKFYKILKA